MKKYIILGIISVAFIIAGILVPIMTEQLLPSVSTLSPLKVPYHETVSGSGDISYEKQNDVVLTIPVVLAKVMVQPGNNVSNGQTVAIVDKNATIAVLSSYSKYALNELGMSEISNAAALIPSEVISPYDGKVIYSAPKGELIQTGYPVVSVTTTSKMVANISINENDVSKIKIGQKANIFGSAFENKNYTGYVSNISDIARKRYNGTVQETVIDVQILVEDADQNLRSGYTTWVDIVTEIPRDIFVLPYHVISQDDEGEFVYVVEKGAAIRRNIETGVELSEGAQILKGVAPDEKVVDSPKNITGNTAIKVQSDVKK